MKNLPHKCGGSFNCTVTYGNDIFQTFQNYVRTTKTTLLIPIISNKNCNVTNFDVIYSNDISTYYQAYYSHGELSVKN